MRYFQALRGKKGFTPPPAETHMLHANLYKLIINLFAVRNGSIWRVVTVGVPGIEKLKVQMLSSEGSDLNIYEFDMGASNPFDSHFHTAVQQASDMELDKYVKSKHDIDQDALFRQMWHRTGQTYVLDYLFPALYDTLDNRTQMHEGLEAMTMSAVDSDVFIRLEDIEEKLMFIQWRHLFPEMLIGDDERGLYCFACDEEQHLLLQGGLMSPYYGNSLALYDYHRHWGLPALPDDSVTRMLTPTDSYPVYVWHLNFDRFVSAERLPF